MDETPIQVLNEPDKPAASQSYMWVQCSGVQDHPVVLFDYSPSRSAQIPIELLHDYQGLLQADGYAGYQQIARDNGLILLGCWAHARRKFDTALKANKVKKGKAQFALSEIQKLYRIEKQVKGKTPEEIKQARQELAKPIIDKLRIWLNKSINQVPPKSLTGKALTYLNNQWDYLTAYLDNGYAAIDNNKAERAIRPFVIGRKNWLFANSVNGAKASSTLYSIVETAKANNIEPWHYLNHVFKELPNTNSVEEIENLLPWNVGLK
jgi:transposase